MSRAIIPIPRPAGTYSQDILTFGDDARPMPITLLQTLGPVLAKVWLADGTIKNYDQAKRFRVSRQQVDDVRDLGHLLREMARDPHACLIRGAPRADLDLSRPVERTLDNFIDEPSRLFMVDVDNFTGTPEEFVRTLPPPFQEATYVLQLSGSHGHPSRPGLRAHLWFWLERPLTCAQAEAYARACLPGTDSSVHRTVQVNYTADPVSQDPLCEVEGGRVRVVQGLRHTLELPADAVPAATAARAGREHRATHVDPRSKPGVIGALCRSHPPAEIVSLFPEHFKAGSTQARITWLKGGGSPDGVGVTSDELGLFNTHATSPIGQRSANLFDFIRAHVFQDADKDLDPDVLDLLPASQVPSFKACEAWARTLPRVQQELAEPQQEKVQEATARNAEVRQDHAESEQNRLDNILKLVAACNEWRKLEVELGPRVASVKLSEADREVIARAMQDRCKALGQKFSITLVRRWLAPASADPSLGFPHLGPDGEILGTIENLQTLLAMRGASIHYDVIKKQQLIEFDGSDAYNRDQSASAKLSWVQSEAAQVRMPHNMGQIMGYLTALAAANERNPVREWIEEQPWDGVSRLQDLYVTLGVDPDADQDLCRLMLRKWLLQCVAAALSPTELSTRGVLVLQGPQYIGKTRWVKALLPDHEHLAICGRQINPHDRDSVNVAISHWICELGELDATFRKSDLSALKSFLGNTEDMFRLPYAPSPAKFQRRTVFMASVNDDQFLSDTTGNTRFWVVPVVQPDSNHVVNMQQVWAEVHQLWVAGESHWFEQDQMKRVEAASRRYEITTAMDERVVTRFPWDLAQVGNQDVVWVERRAFEIAVLLGISNPTTGDIRAIGHSCAKVSGLKSRFKHGGFKVIRIPLLRREVSFEDLDGDAGPSEALREVKPAGV